MRPSLAAERQSEMLDALAACVAEVGIDRLTVQAVADRSGWSRGHVRHYLGNKADQVRALVDLYAERYASALELAVESASPGAKREAVYGQLFGVMWQDVTTGDDEVLEALMAYAAANPTSGVSLTPMYRRIHTSVTQALTERFSDDESARRAEVALSLAYGQATMVRLEVLSGEACAQFGREVLGLSSAADEAGDPRTP